MTDNQKESLNEELSGHHLEDQRVEDFQDFVVRTLRHERKRIRQERVFDDPDAGFADLKRRWAARSRSVPRGLLGLEGYADAQAVRKMLTLIFAERRVSDGVAMVRVDPSRYVLLAIAGHADPPRERARLSWDLMQDALARVVVDRDALPSLAILDNCFGSRERSKFLPTSVVFAACRAAPFDDLFARRRLADVRRYDDFDSSVEAIKTFAVEPLHVDVVHERYEPRALTDRPQCDSIRTWPAPTWSEVYMARQQPLPRDDDWLYPMRSSSVPCGSARPEPAAGECRSHLNMFHHRLWPVLRHAWVDEYSNTLSTDEPPPTSWRRPQLHYGDVSSELVALLGDPTRPHPPGNIV